MDPRRLPLRKLGELLVVGICTFTFASTLVGICVLLLSGNDPGSRDFVAYWAAGQQLVHHANPYAADAILALEQSAGFPGGLPVLLMRNPPSAQLLVLPLGLMGARAGAILWTAALLACFVCSVRLLARLRSAESRHLHLFAYTFAPALLTLLAGQTSLFLLLGLVLFLRLHKSHAFLAGASLWLCALKPHLFLPFAVALLLWVIATRGYKILLGAGFALAMSSLLCYILDPAAWTQYRDMMRTSRIEQEPIPCFSILLRLHVSPSSMWLQYLPAAAGGIWAATYFWRHRDSWNWMHHGSLLMLFSVLVAPYSWLTDQAILIPALLNAVYVTTSRTAVALLALASALIEVLFLRHVPLMHSPLLLWTAPIWLACYLFATRTPAIKFVGAPAQRVLSHTAQ